MENFLMDCKIEFLNGCNTSTTVNTYHFIFLKNSIPTGINIYPDLNFKYLFFLFCQFAVKIAVKKS